MADGALVWAMRRAEAGGEHVVDVAIVGASPAGLRAAWAAGRAGASVLLLERRERLGDPEPPAAVAFDFLWGASFEPPGFAVRRRLDGAQLVSPGGRVLEVDAPLSLLRRARLDPWLADEAEAEGARILTGVRGLDIDADRTVRADNGLVVRARVLVFADGARSLASQFVAPVARPQSTTWGAMLKVEAPGASEARRVRIGVGAHLPGGRSQLNPLQGDEWSHWTFYRGAPEEAEARAREALERDARVLGWPARVAKEATFEGVAADAVYALPRDLAGDGVLVTGGAGGQGGLEVGLSAGELAGATAAKAARSGRVDRASLAPYERSWKRRHAGAYRALRWHTETLARLPDHEVDRLFEAWSGAPLDVRHLSALAHPSPWRRAVEGACVLSQNPRGAPALARVVARLAAAQLRRRSG